MYKSVCVLVIFLSLFAFTSGSRQADASPTTAIGPAIVAHGNLVNQTAPIPATTIFTPTQTGLYRLSIYGTMLTAAYNSGTSWSVYVSWTDETTSQNQQVLWSYDSSLAPFLSSGANNFYGQVAIFEAKAGTPVAYSTTQIGPPDGTSYSLHYTLERLE